MVELTKLVAGLVEPNIETGKVLFSCLISVGKHMSKKNNKTIHKNRRTHQSFIGTNSKTKYLIDYLNMQLLKEKLKQRIDTIECDINASFVFYYPDSVFYTKKNQRSHKVGDIDNLLGGPLDCLQKVGVIINDRIICGVDGTRRKPSGDKNYYLRIDLTSLD